MLKIIYGVVRNESSGDYKKGEKHKLEISIHTIKQILSVFYRLNV